MLTYQFKLCKLTLLSIFLCCFLSNHSFGQKREWFKEREREFEKKGNYQEEEEREKEEIKRRYPLPGMNPVQMKQESMDLNFRLERFEAMKALNKTSTSAASSTTMANGNLTGTWAERGPNNQPGRIRYADMWNATNNIYAVSDGGSVFKGTTTGTGWTCLNDKLKCTAANYIRVIANGTGKRIFVAGRNCIYSDDDGVTWNNSTGLSIMAQPATNAFPISTVVLNDAARTIIMVAVHDWDVYVYRSSDKGTSFSIVKHYAGSGDYWNFVNTFNMWAPYTANSPAYIIKSDSLLQITSTTVTGAPHNLAVSTRANITGTIVGSTTYLYTYTNKVLYRSSNGGTSWLAQTSPSVCDPGGVNCYTPDAWGSYSLSCGLANQNQLYLGGMNISVSTTGGASWTQANYWQNYFGNGTTSPQNNVHTDIPAIISLTNSSSQEVQLVCCDQGLYLSTDYCKTFTSLSMTGLNTNQGYWIYTRPDNPNYIYYGTQDGGYEIATQDASGLLTFNETISGDYSHVVSTDGSTVWTVNPFEVFYSPAGNNGSLTFPSLNFSGSGGMPFLSALLAHPTNTTQAYLGGGHLDGTKTGSYLHLLTYSGGSISYSTLPYDFSQASGGGIVFAIGISKTNPNYRYVQTSTGYFFYSTDGGTNWTANTTNLLVQGNDVAKSAILISKKTPSTVYVCGDGYNNPGVFVSTNNGQAFTSMSNGLPNTYIHSLAFNDDESMIYAATEVGPYVYVVKDQLWYPMTGGTDQAYWYVEYLSASKTARFVTYGRGIWDFKVTSAPTVSITAPANNTYYVAPASVTLSASASETGGTISKVVFYNGSTILGTVTNSPYNYTWNSVAAGTYTITAKAYDLANVVTTSSSVSITVNTTGLPSPWVQSDIGSVGLAGSGTYSNGTFTSKGAGADIYNTADAFHYIYQPVTGNVEIVTKVNSVSNSNAWAKAGVMIRETLNANSTQAMIVVTPSSGVSFQNRTTTGGSSVSTTVAGTAPVWLKINRTGNTFTAYQSTNGTTWTTVGSTTISMASNAYVGLAVCAHTTTALCTTSFSSVNVTTAAVPVVSITSPANNAVIVPGTITINATASETGGTISKVEFYNGATLLGTSTTSPYSYAWASVATGTYSLTAKAYDASNVSTVSSAVSITVDKAPTVSITAPANNSVYQAPGTISFTVNAADTDGTISKVEYYRGGTTLIGTSTTAPFSLNWNSVAAGSYSVTAKAYDNFNVSTTSSAISITVNAAPTVSITSPASGATYNNAPTSVTINTNATDSDGTISKVEFYSNGGLIGTITASPFNYTWNSVAAGTYSLTAKATDNNGGVTTSSAVSITVNSGSNVCANIPQYSTTATYVDGSQVQNVGNYYQCKPYPYTGWCNNPAYAPGTTTYWPDAWTLLGSCTGRMGAGKEVVQMDFYPNPAQSSVVINFNSVNEGTANVMITDMYSKKVMETDMSVVAGSNSVELNLENVFNGIYMVTITKGNDKIVKQLVISK